MKNILLSILLLSSSAAYSAETLLQCKISRIAFAGAFGDAVSLQGPGSFVRLIRTDDTVEAKVGNYARYSLKTSGDLISAYSLSDKDIVYLGNSKKSETVILSISKTRNRQGLRPGRVVLKRTGLNVDFDVQTIDKVAAYLQCQ